MIFDSAALMRNLIIMAGGTVSKVAKNFNLTARDSHVDDEPVAQSDVSPPICCRCVERRHSVSNRVISGGQTNRSTKEQKNLQPADIDCTSERQSCG